MPENYQNNDTISLGTIKQAISQLFNILFRFLDVISNAIRRNIFLFLTCGLSGALLGYFYSSIREPYYEAEMIVQQNVLTRKTYYEIISNLNALIKTQSYSDLSTELNLDKTKVQKIILIEALGLGNESLVSDTSTKLGIPFKIYVKLTDNKVIPELRKGLVKYLNNNQYYKQKRESQLEVYKQKLAFINEQQKQLDSLKETYNRTLASMRSPTTFYNNALNPAQLYDHAFNLAVQRESIQTWLNTEANGISVIDDFKNPENPKSISKPMSAFIGLAAGIILGILLSLLVALKKDLK